MFEIETTKNRRDAVVTLVQDGLPVGFVQPVGDAPMAYWWAHVEVGPFAFDGEGATINEAVENLSMIYVSGQTSLAV